MATSTVNKAHATIAKHFTEQSCLAIPIVISNCKKDDPLDITYQRKIAYFTVDTTIGDRANDAMFQYCINCRYGKDPIDALSLTVHYNGTVSINQSADPVLNKPYTSDFGDNSPMGTLALQLLKQLTANESSIDPFTAIFVDLLALADYDVKDNNGKLSLNRKILDQTMILTAMVKHGSKAATGSPLELFSRVASKAITPSNTSK